MTAKEFEWFKQNPGRINGMNENIQKEFKNLLEWEKRSQAAHRAVRTKRRKYSAWPDRSNKHKS